MGFTGNLVSFLVILTSVILYMKIKPIFDFPEKPQLDGIDDIWWGAGVPWKSDTSIKPFKIQVSDDVSNLLTNSFKSFYQYI